jgi:N-acylneuraminate cytidylyltransferase
VSRKRVIAYIPAKGSSSRLPGKNIRPLGGKPVLARVVEALRALPFVEAVCVSTDDARIARIAHRAGAETLGRRSARLCGPRVDFRALFLEDTPRYLRHFDIPESEAHVIFTLPTAAMVRPAHYADAYRQFVSRRARITVATVGYDISPYWALEAVRGGWRPLFPRRLSQRSQDLPRTQVDAGVFYILDAAPMARVAGHWFRVARGLDCYELPREAAVDVDTPEDWRELERRYRESRAARR